MSGKGSTCGAVTVIDAVQGSDKACTGALVVFFVTYHCAVSVWLLLTPLGVLSLGWILPRRACMPCGSPYPRALEETSRSLGTVSYGLHWKGFASRKSNLNINRRQEASPPPTSVLRMIYHGENTNSLAKSVSLVLYMLAKHKNK